MKGLKRGLGICLLFFTTCLLGIAQGNNKENFGIKNVLYVSSNHDTYYPSAEILAGATNYFKEHEQRIDLKTIYLNSRYVASRDAWCSTLISEMNKLIDKRIDLLIVAGPEAISVIDSIDDPRLRNTPTIYCGAISLNNVKRENVTGLLFDYHYEEVLSIAEKMYPELENVYLIGDQSNYSSRLIRMAQQQLAKFSYKYNIIVNTDLTAVNDVLIFLKSLPKNSFVMMLNWQKTRNGDFCDWTIYYPLFAQNCASPMYRHVKDFETETFAIAPDRYLYKHGQQVGAIGMQILKGTSASDIPVKPSKINWAVSERWLLKEKINSSILPASVTVIPEKDEKEKMDQSLVWVVVILFIPIIVLLSQLLIKRKRIKQDMLSMQILKNEVTNVLKQFENEHAILDGVMNGVNDGVLIIEIDTNRVVNANPLAASIFNLPLNEILGRKIEEIMSMRQGDIAVDVNGYIRSVITSGKKIEFTTKEIFIVCRSGKKVQCNGSFSLLSRHNGQTQEVSAVLLMIRDISAIRLDKDRINNSLRFYDISTWTFDAAQQTVTFCEGEDPLSRTNGTVYTMDTLNQLVSENNRRDLHAFWTDLVRSPQDGLKVEVLIDFNGIGKYELWQLVGFSQHGNNGEDSVIFGSMSRGVLTQKIQPEACPQEDNEFEDLYAEDEFEDGESCDRADKATILIAEDNDSNFLLISKLLKNKYNLFRAKNGEQAILLAEKETPDLILMDMNMPVLDGASATKVIRSKDQKTPIFALTASVYDSDKLKTLKAGCTGYLSKPINKEALFNVLKEYCGY